MPAGSESTRSPPPLPHTFWPLGVRAVVGFVAVALVATGTTLWIALPPDVKDKFTVVELATVVLVGAGILALVYALLRCRVVATGAGLLVVNGFRSHQLEWSQVLGVTLRPGSAWAVLDLSDGTTTIALGIQGSDGSRAQRDVALLRALIDAQTDTGHDG